MGRTRSSSHNRKVKGTQRSDRVPSTPSVPGVQKIKSALRQTRRLLAKDGLAADVRIDTERRLKSLEADLAQAERTRRERNLAVKYHKVKFFERQKVCRKIKHTKKALDAPNTASTMLPSLRDALISHRVDLNYILHYPKTKKYVSLFPSESSKAGPGKGAVESEHQRQELRRWVKAAMERGQMEAEPEETMDKAAMQGDAMDWEEEQDMHLSPGTKGKEVVGPSRTKGVPGDTFFEASDDDSQSAIG